MITILFFFVIAMAWLTIITVVGMAVGGIGYTLWLIFNWLKGRYSWERMNAGWRWR